MTFLTARLRTLLPLRSRAFFFSVLVHALLFAPIRKSNTEWIEITRVERHKLIVKGKKTKIFRLGNNGEGFDKLGLGDRLSAENYFERIRLIIEPAWRAKALARIKLRNRMKLPRLSCISSALVTVNSKGRITNTMLLDKCIMDSHFDTIAMSLWDIRLPPPPKNLIRDNLLQIHWQFSII